MEFRRLATAATISSDSDFPVAPYLALCEFAFVIRFLILCIVPPLCFFWIPNLSAEDLRLSAVPNQSLHLQVPFETWSAVSFEVHNPADEGQDAFITSYFEEIPDQQFGRQYWVPPHSVRRGWYLVKTPPTNGGKEDIEAKALNAMLIRRQGSTERAKAFEPGKRFETSFIRCPKSPARTLLIVGRGDAETKKLVAAARTATRTPLSFVSSTRQTLPPVAAAYEGWTHIVLASNHVLEDPAAVEALRQWTVQGGSLWILLDKTGLEAALPFLADAGGLTVIDRVGLNSFTLASPRKGNLVRGDSRELEDPVEMVRTVSEGFRTLYQIDGWNAAMMTQVGRGSVLITTLGASGWLKPRDETADPRWSGMLQESGYPIPECTSLGEQFWELENTSPATELAPVATEYVGYPVMSLTRVASALALFCGSILVGGVVLWRMTRLAWMSVLAPVAAVLATFGIGVSSHQNRSSIPPTEATIQVAEADAVGNIHIQGGLSVYSASNGDTKPQTTHAGQLEFVTPPTGQGKRLIWSDHGKVHWENLKLNTGVHEFRFQTHQAKKPNHAIFSFNEEGVIGRVAGGEWTLPERGLIVSPNGQFAAPRFLPDGRLVSGSQDSLAPGRFSASEVIDDREQTRMAILENVFADNQRRPSQPRLYFWTDPLDAGFQTQEEGRRVGDALVGLPITYERPPAGGRVFCPSYFIEFRSVLFPGRGHSTAYRSAAREWTDLMVRKVKTTLEIQLPPSLRGLKVDRLKVFVDVHAPDRTFDLLALDRRKPKEIRELAKKQSPLGLMQFELSGESLPPVEENGTFLLGLDVGPLGG